MATVMRSAGLVATLVVLAVAACSPSALPSPTPSPVGQGGVLTVAVAADVTSLDPWAHGDAGRGVVLRQVFETLVDLAPGGYTVVPRLAESWTPSADGLSWTLRLRSGVRFHDGSQFDAAAVAANFARASTLGRADVTGVVAEVAAAEPLTVVFRLRARAASFVSALASPSLAMVSPACLARGPAWASASSPCAAGTGPFRIPADGWTAGERLSLVRHTAYWGRDAEGRALPYLDGLVFQPIADESGRVAALRSAAVEVALDVGVAGARTLRGDPKVMLIRRPPFDLAYLGFGPSLARGNVSVRRAIAMAIDRGAIVQTLYGGDARAAAQLVPPGVLGHDETIAQFTPNDVPAAKRLLTEAGVPVAAIELWYASDASAAIPDPRRLAEALAADLAKVGVTVTPRAETPARLEALTRAGTIALWIGTRAPDRADPDAFLAGMSDDAVVRELLRRADGESDASKRAELYKQVAKLLQQDVTVVPLFHSSTSHGISGKVRGLVAQPVVGESFGSVWMGR